MGWSGACWLAARGVVCWAKDLYHMPVVGLRDGRRVEWRKYRYCMNLGVLAVVLEVDSGEKLKKCNIGALCATF
jgi:hypothetical protein